MSNAKHLRLKAINLAEDLEKHTYLKCRNLRLFPKKDRGGLPTRIFNEAANVSVCAIEADLYSVTSKDDLLKRIALQRQAIHFCILRIHHIELAYDVTTMRDNEFKFWVTLAYNTKQELISWQNFDKEILSRF